MGGSDPLAADGRRPGPAVKMGRSGVLAWGLVVVLAGGVLLAVAPPWPPPNAPPPLPVRVEVVGGGDGRPRHLLLHGALGARPVQGALLPEVADAAPLPGDRALWAALGAVWDSPSFVPLSGFGGVQLFSGRPPASASAVLPLPGNPVAFLAAADRLYLACDRGGVLAIDIRDPEQPRMALCWSGDGLASMAGRKDRFYLLAPDGVVEVAEILADGALRRHSRQRLPSGYRYLSLVAANGLRTGDQLFIFARSLRRAAPHALHSCRLLPDGGVGSCTVTPLPGITADAHVWQEASNMGCNLVVVGDSNRLFVLDAADPESPRRQIEGHLSRPVGELALTKWLLIAQLRDGLLAATELPLPGRSRSQSFLTVETPGTLVKLLPVGESIYAFSRARGLEVYPRSALRRLLAAAPEDEGGAPAVPEDDFGAEVCDVLRVGARLWVLDEDGTVRVAAGAGEGGGALALGPGYRWLAAYGEIVYAGGGATLAVLAADAAGVPHKLSEWPGAAGTSHDAAVVGERLCVAAGPAGICSYALADPRRPVYRGAVPLPGTLATRVDARALAVRGRQLLAAAGAAGVVQGTVGDDGELGLAGVRPFAAPVAALAGVDGLLLVAGAQGVAVTAVQERHNQLLGRLPLAGIDRLRVLDGELIARRRHQGWQRFPRPVVLGPVAGAPSRLPLPARLPGERYRLLLFDDQGVTRWPEPLVLAGAPEEGG